MDLSLYELTVSARTRFPNETESTFLVIRLLNRWLIKRQHFDAYSIKLPLKSLRSENQFNDRLSLIAGLTIAQTNVELQARSIITFEKRKKSGTILCSFYQQTDCPVQWNEIVRWQAFAFYQYSLENKFHE